jgi:hypothetical protein
VRAAQGWLATLRSSDPLIQLFRPFASSLSNSMAKARHEIPPEIASLSLEEIAERYIRRFRDKTADWEAFEDAKIDGSSGPASLHRRRRVRQARRPGDDPSPRFYPEHCLVPPGQANAAHPHEVEEVFFVPPAISDGVSGGRKGRRLSRKLGPWECIACPPGVIHGFQTSTSSPSIWRSCSGAAVPKRWVARDDGLYRRHEADLTFS